MTEAGFEMGLDEAGYGPLLGPLVVGVTLVEGPRDALRDALRSRRRGLPKIRDSKIVFRAGAGFADLELAALAAWALARGRLPDTVLAYWDGHVRLGESHPWYGNLADPLPRSCTRAEVEDAAACLGAELARKGGTIVSARACCHLEGALNQRMAVLDNKADVHLDHVGGAMLEALGELRPGRINCDRLGGRQDYGSFLSRCFPFVPLVVDSEDPSESRYRVGVAGGGTEIRFMVDGERRSKEVALASCLAKYGRELMMDCLNRTFTRAYEGLAPTAGYYRDARRFLKDLEAAAGADAGWPSRLSRRK